MVVMNPDEVAVLNMRCHGLGEDLVDFFVCSTTRFVKAHLLWQIAEFIYTL